MSGGSWEEEPSFSDVNEIEGHSLSILTDLNISCNNFTINANKLNCSKISNKEDVSKCGNSSTSQVVSSKHLEDRMTFSNTFVNSSYGIKDFNSESNTNFNSESNTNFLHDRNLPDVADEVKNSKINNATNSSDVAKESTGHIDSLCLKVSNLNNLSTDINTSLIDDTDGVTVSPIINTKQHYNDFVKPYLNVRHDLEYSFSQFFTDNKPKDVDYIKEFVAGRIANIIDKVRKSKSSSCSDLVNLNSSQCLMKNNEDAIDVEDDKLNVTFSRPGHFSGSIEVLNCFNENKRIVQSKGNDTYDVDMPLFLNTSHIMKKSFSCSGLPDVKSDAIDKHDSILDIELKLDDSIPSEDEKDEYGLPIKRFISNMPPKRDPELSQTIEKYNILRASFCEPSDDITDENEPEPLTQAKNPDTVKEPLLPDFHGGETSPRNIEKPKSKGPMKALVPLQNMTKNMTEMISSPFIKNKGKPTASTTNNTSHVFNESFDEKTIPMAASTPSSDVRNSRKDLFDNSSRATATPNKSVNPNNKPSESAMTTTTSTVNSPVKKITASNLTKTFSKTSKATNLLKPRIRSSLGRRSSSASALPGPSIRAPLTTKLLPNIQDVSSTAGKLMDSRYNKTNAPPINSMSNSTNTTTLIKGSSTSNAKDTTMKKFSTNPEASQKCSLPLRPSVCANDVSSRPNAPFSNLKRPSMVSKFRVPGLAKKTRSKQTT